MSKSIPAKKPSKRKPPNPHVAAVVDFVTTQCAVGERIGRRELEDFAHKLGMIRSELRRARDRALKLKLLKEEKLPPAERRTKRTRYLAPAGRQARKIIPAQTRPVPAQSIIIPAQSSPVDKEGVSTNLLAAALRLVKAHAVEAAAIEAEEKLRAELEQARVASGEPAQNAIASAPSQPRPTTPADWAVLGQSIEVFNKGRKPEEDSGARWAAECRRHPVWQGGSGSGGRGSQ